MEILNDKNFGDKINQNNLVVVDFFATWCGPCKMMAPIFEDVSKQMDEVSFFKVDVDESPETAKQFGVMSIPTLVAIKNGKETDRNIGLINREDLEEFVEKNK